MKDFPLRNGEMRSLALGAISKRKSGVKKLHPAGKVPSELDNPLAPEDAEAHQSRRQECK